MAGKITKYKSLEWNLIRLKRTYLISIYSFEQTRKSSKEDSLITISEIESHGYEGHPENTTREIDLMKKDSFPQTNKERFAHYDRLKGQSRKYLRKMFVVYSVALFEGFLVDLFEQILVEASVYKNIDDKYLESAHNSLGIAKEAYKRKFGINFGETITEYERLNEVFDRRHILVHNGGIITSKFRKKYSKMFIDSRERLNQKMIHISPNYIFDSLELLKSSAFELTKSVCDQHDLSFSK